MYLLSNASDPSAFLLLFISQLLLPWCRSNHSGLHKWESSGSQHVTLTEFNAIIPPILGHCTGKQTC